MQSWLTIGTITFIVALGSLLFTPRHLKWFAEISRPRWQELPVIPIIWIVVFAAADLSATLVWLSHPGNIFIWMIMGIYLLIEIITVIYVPLSLRFKNPRKGDLMGLIVYLLADFLVIAVLPLSRFAGLLLIPYVIWSPIGDYSAKELI
jgi:translocator protein